MRMLVMTASVVFSMIGCARGRADPAKVGETVPATAAAEDTRASTNDSPATIEAPQPTNAAAPPSVIAVSLHESRPPTINGVAMPDDSAFLRTIRAAAKADPGIAADLVVDEDVRHSTVARVIDMLKSGGLTAITITVAKPGEP